MPPPIKVAMLGSPDTGGAPGEYQVVFLLHVGWRATMFNLEFGYETPFFGKATIARAISDFDNQSQKQAAQSLLGEIGNALVEARILDTAAPLQKDQLSRVKQLTYSFVYSDENGVVDVYDGDLLHLTIEHYIPEDKLSYFSRPLEYWKRLQGQQGGSTKKNPTAASKKPAAAAAKKKPAAATAASKTKKPAAATAASKKKTVAATAASKTQNKK
jgi:hypothetical protein